MKKWLTRWGGWGRVWGMKEQKCPICGIEMDGMEGHKMYPNNKEYGYTLYCLNMGCSAEEVFGHGKNEKEAYEVVMAKYGGKK